MSMRTRRWRWQLENKGGTTGEGGEEAEERAAPKEGGRREAAVVREQSSQSETLEASVVDMRRLRQATVKEAR